MLRRSAFSLIELMVVIAIVAILAAVAVPAYENYIIKSKISSGLQFMQMLSETVKIYYTQNGSFPYDVTKIGYTTDGTNGPGFTTMPTGLSDYVQPPYVGAFLLDDNSLATPKCSSISVGVMLSNFKNGDFFGGSGYMIYVYNNIYDVKGTIYNQCVFYPPMNQASDVISNFELPNCLNLFTTEGQNANAAFQSFVTANCS